MKAGYPILIDLSRRRVVIVGGSAPAARKAHNLLSAGAEHVRVIATQFHESMPPRVDCDVKEYLAADLDGADLVFAAADDAAINARVVEDALARRILVNRCDEDDDHAGDFVCAAMHRDGSVTVGVSAGSAALSASIRDGIAARFDPRWTRMAEAMRVLRPRIRDDAHLSAARKRAIFRDLADEDALAAATAGPEHVWKWLVSKHPDLARH